MSAKTEIDRDLLYAFRDAVRATILREIEAEKQQAEDLRRRAIPLAQRALEGARRQGLCGAAWLFGSYAWGKPAQGSDVDLLVEGCSDPDWLAVLVGRETGTEVHVIRAETAQQGLRERVDKEGIRL